MLLDEGGVNGQIMPDGTELGIPTNWDQPIDLYQPVYTNPDAILANPAYGQRPIKQTTYVGVDEPHTTTMPSRVVTPVRQIDATSPPALTTGPPYLIVQDYMNPGTDNPNLILTGQGGQSGVGAPANLPPNPDPLQSAIQGTPIATVTNPPASTIPPTGALPLMNLDPITAAVNGVPANTGATSPSTSIPLVTPTVPASTPGTISIFGYSIPTWWLWVLGIGGVLWLLFGGRKRR
jgi:hypothetical protein